MANHHLSQFEKAQNLWTGPLMTKEMHWSIFHDGGQKSKVMRKNSSFVCLFWRKNPIPSPLCTLSQQESSRSGERTAGFPNSTEIPGT